MRNSDEQTFSTWQQQALLQKGEIVSHPNVSLALAGPSAGYLRLKAVRRALAVRVSERMSLPTLHSVQDQFPRVLVAT